MNADNKNNKSHKDAIDIVQNAHEANIDEEHPEVGIIVDKLIDKSYNSKLITP